MNELTTKLYKVDWDFIKKNYLNQKLWNKEWVLLEYDTLKVSMQLDTIDVFNNSITMRIKTSLSGESTTEYMFLYDREELTNENYTKTLVRKVQSDINIIARLKVKGSFDYEEKFDQLRDFEYEIKEEVYGNVQHLYEDLPSIIKDAIDLDSLIENIVDSNTEHEWYSLRNYVSEKADTLFRKERAMVDLIIGGNTKSEFTNAIEDVELPDYDMLDMEEFLELVEEEVKEGFEY